MPAGAPTSTGGSGEIWGPGSCSPEPCPPQGEERRGGAGGGGRLKEREEGRGSEEDALCWYTDRG